MNPLRAQITDEMVDDIVTTAMEGGSNYWTTEVAVIGGFPAIEGVFASECLTKGRDLAWFEQTEDGPVHHTLTLAKMKTGIRRAAAHFGLTVEAFSEDADATMADVAVQLALFPQIVYG